VKLQEINLGDLYKKSLEFDNKVTSGEKLIKAFGLENFRTAYIQKVINTSLDIFVITVDSRYYYKKLTHTEVKRSITNIFSKLQVFSDIAEAKELRVTPPIELTDFKGKIHSNALVIRQDISGERFVDKSIFTIKY